MADTSKIFTALDLKLAIVRNDTNKVTEILLAKTMDGSKKQIDPNTTLLTATIDDPSVAGGLRDTHYTPVAYAARVANNDTLKAVIDAGGSVNNYRFQSGSDKGKTADGTTPLIEAAASKVENKEKLQTLFSNQADLDTTDQWGKRPLVYAKDKETADLITKRQQTITNTKDLYAAIDIGPAEIKKITERPVADFDANYTRRYNSTKPVTAVEYALSKGNPETLKALPEQIRGDALLSEFKKDKAVPNRDQNIDSLIASGIALDKSYNNNDGYKYTAATRAAGYGDNQALDKLKAAGANLNAKDVDGYTPLISASVSGETETVKKLLENKSVIINDIDNTGQTPLIKAVTCNNPETAKLLLTKGADAKIKDKAGHTAKDYELAKPEAEQDKNLVAMLNGKKPSRVAGAAGPTTSVAPENDSHTSATARKGGFHKSEDVYVGIGAQGPVTDRMRENLADLGIKTGKRGTPLSAKEFEAAQRVFPSEVRDDGYERINTGAIASKAEVHRSGEAKVGIAVERKADKRMSTSELMDRMDGRGLFNVPDGKVTKRERDDFLKHRKPEERQQIEEQLAKAGFKPAPDKPDRAKHAADASESSKKSGPDHSPEKTRISRGLFAELKSADTNHDNKVDRREVAAAKLGDKLKAAGLSEAGVKFAGAPTARGAQKAEQSAART